MSFNDLARKRYSCRKLAAKPVEIHGALARVWRGSVKADSIILPPNEAAVFEVETR